MALVPVGNIGNLTLNGIDPVGFVADMNALQVAGDNVDVATRQIAADDATAKADNAVTNANTYADQQDATVLSSAGTDATNKANTAKAEAISDATTKYSGALRVMPNLSTEDLNTVTAQGIYPQAVSGNATLARNYPVGSAGRGQVTVTKITGSIVWQVYEATFLRRIFVREYSGTAWSVWTELATLGSATSLTIKPNLSTEDLNTLKTAGIYPQATSGNATTARNYPNDNVGGRGILTVLSVSASIVSQEYNATFQQRVYYREYDGAAWSTWKEIGSGGSPAPSTGGTVQEQRTVQLLSDYRPDAWAQPDGTVSYWTGPSGTERIGWDYKGGGYVGKLGAATGYTTMQIKKMQSNDEVEVSCLNPATGRHVTHRVQGKGPLAGQDDQRRFEEAWVGTYTGTTVSKDLAAVPRSNMEWAFQINVGGNSQFAPYHGSTSVYAVEYEAATITDGQGAAIDLTGMAVNEVKSNVAGFKIRQRLYLSHPDSPTVKLVAVDEVHTISPDGLLQSEAVVTFLEDTVVGSNYAPMTPVDQATFGNMKVQGGSTYAIQTTPPATTEYLTVAEGHAVDSALFWSNTESMAFVAVNFLNRPASFMVGSPLEDTTAQAMRIEQRSTSGLTKLYPQPFIPGSTIPKGTVWRPGAQWRVGQVTSAGSYA